MEIRRQLPGLASHLKPDVTIRNLEHEVRAKTDNTAAEENAESQTGLIRWLSAGAERMTDQLD
jgi:hypothetical protein